VPSITSPAVSTHLRPRGEKAREAGPALGLPLYAISRFNWSPEPAEVRPLFKAPREDGSWFRAELDCSSTIRPQQKMKTRNMTTLHSRKSIDRSPLRRGFLLIPLVAFACFALSPDARGTCQDACVATNNTIQGDNALINNTGTDNTAFGYQALTINTSGYWNTAIGSAALASNMTGAQNTAIGKEALENNTASFNTANGSGALYSNTTGQNNTANGFKALYVNKGSYNIALGDSAGANLTTGNYNIDIGNAGVAAEANTIRIGNGSNQTATFIAGISGVTVAGGVGVIIDNNGHLGTVVSSERFKEAVKPMDKASEAILHLRPVTFRYRHELDPDGIPQFGLVAEQVEKVNPYLVARNAKGKPYAVRYEAVNAMLLNEFLKEHRKVQELEVTVAQQHKGMEVLAARLQEQATQIQKVSAQLELSKPVPRTVVNNR
jgi:endosialidase-like protein